MGPGVPAVFLELSAGVCRRRRSLARGAGGAIAPGATGKEVVLVVEDDPTLRAYTVESLGEFGYRVIEAANSEAALANIDREPDIDLLFTDVVMPGRSMGDSGRTSLRSASRIASPAHGPGLFLCDARTVARDGGAHAHRGGQHRRSTRQGRAQRTVSLRLRE